MFPCKSSQMKEDVWVPGISKSPLKHLLMSFFMNSCHFQVTDLLSCQHFNTCEYRVQILSFDFLSTWVQILSFDFLHFDSMAHAGTLPKQESTQEITAAFAHLTENQHESFFVCITLQKRSALAFQDSSVTHL